MMRQDESDLGMLSTHPNAAGETEEEDADAAADYEDDADSDSDADEDEADEEEERDSERVMRLVCAYCGETNRLRPPRGYEFASQEDEDGDAEERQIRYRCTCGEINRLRVALTRESEAVRTFRESYYGRRE